MEPERQAMGRAGWVALAILGVALLLGLTLLLGPFGDDELTEAGFVAQGDEICADAHDDFEALQSSPPRTATEAAELTKELVKISSDEQDAIADLDPPASLDAQVGRYLDARSAGIGVMEDGLAAAEEGDAFAYSKLQADVASSQLEREKLARKVGFEQCSRVLFGKEALERDSAPPPPSDPTAPPTVSNPPTGAP